MKRARALWLLGFAAVLLAVPARAGADRPLDCGRHGVVCSRVQVPLDWSGKLHGTVSLEVKISRAEHPRGVMFLLAGGPGQASADVYLFDPWQYIFPDYTLVAFDPRGTGHSGRIRCNLTRATHATAAVAACARELGPARDFYSTADNARDLDAVRRELGFERIGVFGVSYGTDVALTYARMFPSHVERLLLDSVATPLTALPLVRGVLHALPSTLTRACAQACIGVTSDFGRDAVRLANALGRHPLRARVLRPGGGTRLETLDAAKFLGVLISTDLDAGLAAEMPAAVRAALSHDSRPLLRLVDLVEPADQPLKHVDAVYLATTCDDGPLPWPPGTPVAKRRALLRAAESRVSGLVGRFGPWAAAFGNADLCYGWPDSAASAPTPAGRYPDVPVLALSGDLDLRSPTFEARAAISRFPRGHLLAVEGAGHSVLPSAVSVSGCIQTALHSWLEGGPVPQRCAVSDELVRLGPYPAVGAKAVGPAETLALVEDTLREAVAASLLAEDEGLRTVAGLAGGILSDVGNLAHYSLGGGVAVTGRLSMEFSAGGPRRFHGTLRVERGGKSIGELALNSDGLEGILDGERVSAGKLSPPATSASGVPWSDWAPPQGPTTSVAQAIAAHVGSRYLISDGGASLLDVTQGPPRSPQGRLAEFIYLEHFASDRYFLSSTAWTYTLCGRSADCVIPGAPTETRFRVVAREALELALYTFEYTPSIETVLVHLPPAQGAAPATHALLFQRKFLTPELSGPLVKTLPRALPPVSTDADLDEAKAIDLLTHSLFTFRFVRARGGEVAFLTDG